ncbi:Histone-lysine N-methyltransferase [Coemansia sp. RSA 1972]|nr:Histone-lysine N-methyltransferase [Coemansia sp. RSA 1972]
MVGERRKERPKERSRGGRTANSASASKISIGNLVKEGLLTAGNVVVCNAWPFSAVVTSTGTFTAQWSPEPPNFISGVGSEFMRTEFETPSAWATAVCRVVRAQAQAHKEKSEKNDKRVRGKVPTVESRVAVNGWTACRVRVSQSDENWDLVQQLDGDAKREGDVVKVSLDTLRQEMTTRVSKRTVRRPGWRKSKKSVNVQRDERPMDLDSRNSGTDDDEQELATTRRNSAELQEISGAVDGLARRVESDLALGCVKQRRAAATAATLISASAHPLVTSPSKSTANGSLTDVRRHIHGRKRKSIPDMSRHAKQSRVPSDTSDSASDVCVGMDAGTRSQLAYFRERADALKRTNSELKALRYQRKQQLKRRIANALDLWLHQRAAHRVQRRKNVSRVRPVSPVPSAAVSPVAAMSDGAISVGINGINECVARVCVPESQLALGLPQLCTACGSAGNVDACRGCGDLYHSGCGGWDCVELLAFVSQWRVCPTCRVCAQCLDRNNESDLLQCDECGIHMHSLCSAQTAAHSDGLFGAVREAGGRWVCDSCVRCAECGFTMPDRSSDSDHAESPSTEDQRTRWAHDYSMCGTCALQIDRGRVCPECVSTYANFHNRDTSMVCCDVCQFWVHAGCDPLLEPQVYDALITLEDEAYVCPRCCVARGGVLESSSRDASDTESDSAGPWLPRCLRTLDVVKPEHSVPQEPQMDVACETPRSAKSEPEMIEEAANLLLSLTHSDVRFGYHRFNVDALEQKFCVRKLRTRREYIDDWRMCALCGLRGDGTQMLGRLVPMYTEEKSAKQWVHVECVAWAWGPRPVRIDRVQSDDRFQSDDRVQRGVRFEGALLDGSSESTNTNLQHLPTCALCTRPNASFHCCAPVPCYDTAFHLPCLLLDGTLSPSLAPERAQYCAAWRRALCATHAPMFAAMMPADGAIKSPSYDHDCVQVRVDDTGLARAKCDDQMVDVVGGLVVFEWGEYSSVPAPGLRCLRVFSANGESYAVGVETHAKRSRVVWHGWIGKVPNDLMARVDHTTRASSLTELLTVLFAQMPEIAASSPLASVLVKTSIADALRFIGLPSIIC